MVIGKAIRLSLKSFFSQVPATFRVSDDGTDVRITSPIIALGPRDRHPRLYFAIESVFRVALPLLERVYEFTHTYKDSPSGMHVIPFLPAVLADLLALCGFWYYLPNARFFY